MTRVTGDICSSSQWNFGCCCLVLKTLQASSDITLILLEKLIFHRHLYSQYQLIYQSTSEPKAVSFSA